MDGFKESSQKIVKREVSTKKNHLLSLFKNFEVTVLDKKKKYFDKLQSLISAWEQIGTFVAETSSESPQPEFDSLFLHTLRLVLRADWRVVSKATKTHLSTTLTRIIADLKNGKRFFSILPQCRVLESVINDPWDHAVLKKIFQDETIEIDELIDYFHFENGKVIVIRLEILLESKCEDLAARLSKACLMTFYLTDPLELELNQDEVDYMTDIYLCCLYRAKNTKDLVEELKIFDIYDGLHLLRRYNKQEGVGNKYNQNCKDARIWKSSKKVMELISSTLLANAVLQDNLAPSDKDVLHDLIREWASVHTSSSSDIFSPVPLEMIWKCVLIARSSMCIYPFCSFLMERGGKQHDLNHLLRCLIRAINQNMNEIEQHRVCRDNEKLKYTHDLLANGFLIAAELFREYRNIYKECLLTAFSLTPTRESLQRLQDCVNNDVADINNALTTPATDARNEIKTTESNSDNPEDLNRVKHSAEIVDTLSSTAPVVSESVPNNQKAIRNELSTILETMGVNGENNELTEIKTELNTSSGSLNETIKGTAPPYITEVESMRIEDSIKTDLNSILRYQRHHTLTWDFEWPALKVNCEKYHEMFEKRGFEEVELKYLELDYDQFKNRPIEIDDSAGIEKGYEHFMTSEIEESDDEYGYSGKVGYSSDDSFYDEDYGRKKRKKSRNRYDEDYDWSHKTTTKKKRPKPKMKIESRDTADEHSADSLPNGDQVLSDKKTLPGSKSSDSETNADSQSENQPPDGDESKTHISDDNLKILRQFRISLSKPLISEENTTNIARQLSSEESINRITTAITNNDLEKSTDRIFIDGDSMRLVICIPKCDSYPYSNDVQLLDAFLENLEAKSEKLSSLEKSSSSEKLAFSEKPPTPFAVVEEKNNSSNRGRGSFSNRDGFSKHRVYPKTNIHAKRFALNSKYRKKLYGAPILQPKQSSEGIDDLIGEIFPEFSSNGSWQTNGNFGDEAFFEAPMPPPPVVPCQQHSLTLTEFSDTTLDSTLGPTSSNEATFVSSTVELPPLVLPITPVADGSSPPSCNELTPLQPASSPPIVQALTSYLTSSIDSIDSMYSYPSNMCHNQLSVQQSLTNEDLSAYESSQLLDISTSVAEPAYSNYPNFQQQVPDDVYSMNVSSTYDGVVAMPSSSCVPTSLSPMLANGVVNPAVHSNDGAGFSPVTAVVRPESKLREALQKEKLDMNCTVTLHDIAHMKKLPLKAEPNDSEAVNQILVEYRDTMDKHPELRHVPARRKRGQDQSSAGNPPKRGRRAKNSNRSYTLPSSNQVQVPSAVGNSPMLLVQVPSPLQQQIPSSSDQVNNVYGSTSSDAARKLPGCVTVGISSQTYGDVGSCKSEVASNVSTFETYDSSHVNMNGYPVAAVCVPSQTTNSYWPDNTNLMNSVGTSMPVIADNSYDDLKVPFFVATVCNDNSTESTDPDVCISIPEYQYSDACLQNYFPLGKGAHLLQSSEYSKNQNDEAVGVTQSVQYVNDGAVLKQENVTFENGVVLNVANFSYDSNYSTEMNNYGT